MKDASHLTCLHLSPPQLAAFSPEQRQRLLGLACLGGSAADWPAELPVQHIAAPLLGASAEALNEIWSVDGACRSGSHGDIRYRADDHLLYGTVEVDEARFAPDAGASPLQWATEDAYRRIFALLDAQGYAHLWRAWNYLTDINVVRDGLERYRQFNVGRQDAFLASGRLARGQVPAACALGTRHGPLTIAFMAGRTPPTPVENPRQMSAYDYPADYGPRSPTFSRAVLARLPGQELLFVSGTASIVGHETVHVGDVDGQTHETVANIEALLAAANAKCLAAPYGLADLRYRAYLRHADDHVRVAPMLDRLLGPGASVIYVRADICRPDLLIELEAVASHALGSS